MKDVAKRLQKLSARLVATELDVAFKMIDVARYAQAQGDKEVRKEALRRARRCTEWIKKFIDGLSEEDRLVVEQEFEELQTAIEEFSPMRVGR